MAVKQEFESRFAKHKDELEWLFMELYHNREGLEVLEREMAEAYNARSAELKALDKARSADPEWYKRRRSLVGKSARQSEDVMWSELK